MRQLFVSILILFAAQVLAQDTVRVRDLSHGWITVDKNGAYSSGLDDRDHDVLLIDLPQNVKTGQLLRITSPKPVDIWWKEQLVVFQSDSTMYFLVDTLMEGGRLKLYARGGIPDQLKTDLLAIEEQGVAEDPILGKNNLFHSESYLIIGAILLLLGGLFRRNFTITFYQSFQNPLSYKIRSISVDQTYVTFGSIDNIYSIIFFSTLVSFLLQYHQITIVNVSVTGFWGNLITWLLASLWIFIGIWLKFLAARLVGSLYQINDLPNIQIQDFIHFFTLVISIGVAISFIDFAFFDSGSEFLRNFTVYLLIGATLFFQVWLYFKLDKFYSVRKLMIISYLCTTEFFPGFLAIYWLTKM